MTPQKQIEEGLRDLDMIAEGLEFLGLSGASKIKAAAQKIREGKEGLERSR